MIFVRAACHSAMTKNKIVGAIAALGLLSAPAVAIAHGNGDDHGNKGGREHSKHNHKGKHHSTPAPTGTVQSFAAGELTIALPNGKTYSGLVTRRTILKCRTAAPQGSTTAPTTTAPASSTTPASATLPVKARKANNRWHHGNGRCGTDALVAGTSVSAAKLSLKDGEATWKKVELLK